MYLITQYNIHVILVESYLPSYNATPFTVKEGQISMSSLEGDNLVLM